MVARLRGRALSNAIDVLFEELRRVPKLSTDEIQSRVRAYFQRCLNQALEHSIDFPGDPGVEVTSEVAHLNKRIAELRTQLSSHGFDETVICGAHDLLGEIEPQLSVTPDIVAQARIGVARAEAEKARILAAMLSGRYDEVSPRDPLFMGMAPKGTFPFGKEPETQSAQPSLAQIAELYFDFHAKNWVSKTAADQRRVINLIIEVMGGDKPIQSVDIEDIKRVRDALAKLPPNFMKSKANKGKKASQAIAENSDGRSLSAKTQQKYLEMLRQLFNWAVSEAYIEKVPGKGVKVAGAAKGNAAKKRDPYSMEQVQAILASPLYQGDVSRDGRFWAFLVALFSGLRMDEILPLTVADLKREGGILYFDVVENAEIGKSLKTEGSRRRVPVHQMLLGFGFEKLIEGKGKSQRLFPDVEKGPDGRYSTNFSKWWGRYGRRVGFWEKGKTFHSTRHNFIAALRAADLPDYVNRALTGHKDNTPHAQYGGHLPMEKLKAAVDKVTYPVDFNFLIKY